MLNKGWRVGAVLSFGHVLNGEPGDGISGGVMVFKHDVKLFDEVKEGSDEDSFTGNSILLEGGCPGEG